MNQSTIWWRRPLPARAAALAFAALLGATASAAAQDDAGLSNVIVDDSALDSLPEAPSSDSELLPPPAQRPISRIVRTGDSAIEAQTPPETTADSTFAAVPTTPITSSGLTTGGADAPAAPFDSGSTSESFIPDTPIGSTPAAVSDEPIVAATSSEPLADGSDTSDATFAEAAPAEPAATDSGTEAGSAAETTPAAGEAADADDEEAPDDSEEVDQTAALPPVEGMLRVAYAPEATTLSDAAKERLAPLLAQLNEDYGLRLHVLAYAEGDEDESTHARGVSLARALALRDYLGEQGIGPERMDLKALGNSAQEEPADRVDLIAVSE